MTGDDIVGLAKKHVGEKYVFGVLVPKNDPTWDGPWDCSEFASWLVYQESQLLYGCDSDNANPQHADAYTGYWERDANTLGKIISIAEAANIPGAFVLRLAASGECGHIVVSDGKGGTVEAHSHVDGVITDVLDGRRWSMGVLVPGITYGPATPGPAPSVPVVYRLTSPLMQGDKIREIQVQLTAKGFDTDGADGIFGHKTFAAVLQFQQAQGLLTDGEVGPRTAQALGITL